MFREVFLRFAKISINVDEYYIKTRFLISHLANSEGSSWWRPPMVVAT